MRLTRAEGKIQHKVYRHPRNMDSFIGPSMKCSKQRRRHSGWQPQPRCNWEAIEAWDLVRMIHRTGAFLFDPSLMMEYYERLRRLVDDERLLDPEWTFLRRVIESLSTEDPLLWTFVDSWVIDARLRRPLDRWRQQRRLPNRRDARHLRRPPILQLHRSPA